MGPLRLEIRRRVGGKLETLLCIEKGASAAEQPSLEVYAMEELALAILFEDGSSKYFRPNFVVMVNHQPIRLGCTHSFDKESVLYFDFPLLHECLDQALLSVKINSDGVDYCFETLIKVVDREGETDQARLDLRAISQFVEEHAALFLANANVEKIIESRGFEVFRLENRLREIAELYARSLAYFRTNALFKLSTEEKVEPFSRLRNFSASAMHYLVSHPFELEPAETGILINGCRFTAAHTLVRSKIPNFNVYENRILLGFLRVVCEAAEKAEKSYGEELISRLRELLKVYESVFSMRAERLFRLPKPTPAMTSVDTYRRFYLEILHWFKEDDTVEERSRFISDARLSGRLYEYYCLLKILYEFKNEGWIFKKDECIDWEVCSPFYRPTSFSNYFCFEKDGLRREIFFEPVVYSDKVVFCERLGLFRSTRIKIAGSSHDTDSVLGAGAFFTPDFVIRDTYENGSRSFSIADAKYSTQSTVHNYVLKDFLFKYGFGIRPLRNKDRIDRLILFCGKGNRGEFSNTSLSYPNPLSGLPEQDVWVYRLSESNA